MMASDTFKDLDMKKTLGTLGSGRKGLSESEAARRLRKEGYNEIEEKKQNYLVLFFSKFYGPVPLLLILIMLLSYILGNFNTMYIVFALLLLNTLVAFYEEYRADLSVELLKKRLSSNARVMRFGAWKVIPSRELVPGDIIRLRFGDIVPADAKVMYCDYLEIDESVITGESLPVAKKPEEMAYEGSIVKAGEATCVVARTGGKTLYGETANVMESAKPKSHIQAAIMHIVRYLVAVDTLIIIVLFTYGILVLRTSAIAMLPFLLIVFLASVPVALPAAFTVSMALGTEKLAKKSILVRKLDAVEDTATMNVLCMDKTGTLTKNQIVVKELVSFGVKESDLVRYAAEASREDDKDPIDNALLNYASRMHVKAGRQIAFTPFQMSTKRTDATIRNGGREYKVVKGAVMVVCSLCRLGGREKGRVSEAVKAYAKKGFRSIAVAVGENGTMRLVGIIALYDEPREDARGLISELNGLGVDTKMLTGDNVAVAGEMASELGLKGRIIDMSKVGKTDGKSLFPLISRAAGFANIFPEDKYIIVKALQGHKKITGMTGDGINDAPALRQAEVGIAVSNATDVAKSAAAIVITQRGIGVIIEAVKESRRIFERMLTYTMTKVARVVQIVGFIAILFLGMHGFIAITPFLLILLMFTNDISNIAIATDNALYSKIPDIWRIRSIMYSMGVIGMLLIVQALLLVPLSYVLGLTVVQFQTCAFLLLDISDKFTIFNMREKGFFWKSRPSNALLLGSLAGILAGILFSYYGIFVSRISVDAILSVIALSVLFFFVVDIAKVSLFRRYGIR